jgi:predicted PurR-regulated permease PerM
LIDSGLTLIDGPAEPKGAEDLEQILRGPFQIRSVTLTLLLAVVIAGVLRFTRGLFLPITLAVLVQFVLEPVVRLMRAVKIPAAAGAAIVLLTLLGISGYGLYRVYAPALEWAKEMPRTLRQVEDKLGSFKGPVEQVRKATEQVEDMASFPGTSDGPVVRLEQPGLAESMFANLSELAAGLTLGLVLAYFLLANEGVFLHRARPS